MCALVALHRTVLVQVTARAVPKAFCQSVTGGPCRLGSSAQTHWGFEGAQFVVWRTPSRTLILFAGSFCVQCPKCIRSSLIDLHRCSILAICLSPLWWLVWGCTPRSQHVAINITQGKLDVGTGCSGTDIWIAVLERLVSFWDLTFGLKFTIQHVLSCESVEYKQRFIAAHFTPTMIIGDLFDLAQQTVVDIEGKSQTISNLLMWCCGIECDSISQLSRKAAENRGCVAAGEGRTGSTARAHLAFLATHRPPFWEAENVKKYIPRTLRRISQIWTP
jgi:hypothetical protein